jgi:hypothetical protein
VTQTGMGRRDGDENIQKEVMEKRRKKRQEKR